MAKKKTKRKPITFESPIWGKSYWSPEMGLSPSGIVSFLRCREQFRLRYVKNLAAKRESLNALYGSCVHYVLEAFQDDAPNVEDVKEHVHTFWDSTRFMGDAAEKRRIIGILPGVIDGYFHHWQASGMGWNRESRIEMEKKFSLDVGERIPLLGQIDMVVKRGKTIKIRDVKTKTSIPATYERQIPTQTQFMSYMTAAKTLWDAVNVIEIDVIRYPQLKVTKEDGSLAGHIERVRKDALNRPNHYYSRFPIRYTKKELAKWVEVCLRPILRTVSLWWEGKIPHHSNPEALFYNHAQSEFYNAIVHNDYTGLKVGSDWNKYLDANNPPVHLP